MQIVIANKYKLVAQQAYSSVYQGIEITTGNHVTVKMKTKSNTSQLLHQGQMLQIIQTDHLLIDRGVPQLYHMGTQGQYDVIVTQKLGRCCNQLLKKQPSGTFSLKTTLMLLDQMFRRVQLLHLRGIVHRNIQIRNFMMGNHKYHPRKLYLANLGTARKYIHKQQHDYGQGSSMMGSPRWVSINVHMGLAPTRRDDCISLMYLAVYMLRGVLPWQHQQAQDKQTLYNMILSKKLQYRAELLWKHLPQELMMIYLDVCKLQFNEEPHYELYKQHIQSCLQHNNLSYDYVYDWI